MQKLLSLSVLIFLVACSTKPTVTAEILYGEWEGRTTQGDIVALLEIKEDTVTIQYTGEVSGRREVANSLRNEGGNLVMKIDGIDEVFIVSSDRDGRMYLGLNDEDRQNVSAPLLSTLTYTKAEQRR